MIIIPVLALSALFQLTNPDVTLPASRTTSTISVAHSGAGYIEIGLEYPSLPQTSKLSLPGKPSRGVGRDVQLGSPLDLALCSTSVPTLSRKFSPTHRAVTHDLGSHIHKLSRVFSNAASRAIAYHVPSSGLLSSSSSRSTPDFYLNASVNASSTPSFTSLPVYGPEWEWSPRDMIVYVPQPSCPVPVLRCDMSTPPSLHRCTLRSQDYYSELIRATMLKRAASIRRKLVRRELMRQQWVAIESVRQREFVQLMAVYRYGQAWQPIALCLSALVVCYGLFIYALCDTLGSDEKNTSCGLSPLACVEEPLESSTPPTFQDLPSAPALVDVPKETMAKTGTTFYKPRHCLPIPRPSPPPAEASAHIPVIVKCCKPRRLRSPLPPGTPVDPTPFILSEPSISSLEAVVEESPVKSLSPADEEEVRIEKKPGVVQPEQNGEAQGDQLRRGETEHEALKLLSPLPPFAPASSSALAPSDLVSETLVVDLPVEPRNQQAVAQDKPEKDITTAQPARSSQVEPKEKVLEVEEKGKGKEIEGETCVGSTQGGASTVKQECEENRDVPKPVASPYPGPNSSLPPFSGLSSQKPESVAEGSSAKPIKWVELMFEGDPEDTQLEREEERRDQAWLEELAREEVAREETGRKGKGREDVRRLEEKLEEIKLKMVEEQVEALRMAEVIARRSHLRVEEPTASLAKSEPVTEGNEERWEMVKKKRWKRSASSGIGCGGAEVRRRWGGGGVKVWVRVWVKVEIDGLVEEADGWRRMKTRGFRDHPLLLVPAAEGAGGALFDPWCWKADEIWGEAGLDHHSPIRAALRVINSRLALVVVRV
ncbi:hypothetical protein BDV93DRAFT_609939 [Ceratobasidium sp. AG-I]|nr:hypothetical protein BDV93DRAFT_609939 [Ceratobasidium sp. AG-I]